MVLELATLVISLTLRKRPMRTLRDPCSHSRSFDMMITSSTYNIPKLLPTDIFIPPRTTDLPSTVSDEHCRTTIYIATLKGVVEASTLCVVPQVTRYCGILKPFWRVVTMCIFFWNHWGGAIPLCSLLVTLLLINPANQENCAEKWSSKISGFCRILVIRYTNILITSRSIY